MRRIIVTLVAVALAAGLSGCLVTEARQTLRHLDGRTLVLEGRRDVCLRVLDDDTGAVVEEECDLVEDPLGMSEYAVFGSPDGFVLVGFAPVDVVGVSATVDGRQLEGELVETDLVTAIYLVDLPADTEEVTVVGRTATGDPIDEPLEVELPD